MIDGYSNADIFNADETAVYYKQLPDRTLSVKTRAVHGGKRSKERITVLLCGSMEGEKLPLLVIGKSESPRCLRGIHNLPCQYEHSKNAWMTTMLFQKWLSTINRRMASEGRYILLFLDNAACHNIESTYSNIKLMYFPPNCTPVLQPMDQGVIWSFKCLFRRYLLEYILSLLEDTQLVRNTEVNLLLAMHLMTKAWSSVHPDIILNSYIRSGFHKDLEKLKDVCSVEDYDMIEGFKSFIAVDDRLFEEELEALPTVLNF